MPPKRKASDALSGQIKSRPRRRPTYQNSSSSTQDAVMKWIDGLSTTWDQQNGPQQTDSRFLGQDEATPSTIEDHSVENLVPSIRALEARRVMTTAEQDPNSVELQRRLVPQLSKSPRLTQEDLVGLFERTQPKMRRPEQMDHGFVSLDTFKKEFRMWQRSLGISPLSHEEFDMIRASSAAGAKIDVRRAVIPSIVNSCCRPDLFSVQYEGAWKVHDSTRLPLMTREDYLAPPKPDTSISFHFDALNKLDWSSPCPQDLNSALCPNKGCFPFLFVEPGDGSGTERLAHLTNLYTATQALYNIFQWTSRAGLNDTFQRHVRTFSVVLTSSKIDVRVHRAVVQDDHVHYKFDQVYLRHNYSKDDACQLFNNILDFAGEQVLLDILRRTFQAVSGNERCSGLRTQNM